MMELDPARLGMAAGLVGAYLATCFALASGQRRKRREAALAVQALTPAAMGGSRPVLVAFASQSGSSEALAWQTARALHAAEWPVRLLPLSETREADLLAAERALFILSTYGEGDPPDSAAGFASQLLGRSLPLQHLQHAVLALGDRQYRQFCAFGRHVDAWLQGCGASPLFERVEVDNQQPAGLQQWRQRLADLLGDAASADWEAEPAFTDWQLIGRRHLNPGSAGGPLYQLDLAPPAGQALPAWEAGDLVQVQAPGDPDRPREYSLASLPADGCLQLLVRQERHADGRLGRASGWLTEQAALGSAVPLRLRINRNFRLGDNAGRPLILIGNGSGWAGLRSHLKALAAAAPASSGHWLVYGERQAEFDFHPREEIAVWQRQHMLAQCDLVFSRDAGPGGRYVQDRLRERADLLREWVLQRDAALYVCGSLQGMASGVDAVLREVLGDADVAQLLQAGRYRRDVY